MSLCVGALADAYGRRPLLLGSLLLVLTSAGCVLSERIEQLWVLRAIQGAAACVGMILSRTIIRDLVSGLQAQKMIGHVSLIQSLFPMLTPLLGAWVAAWYGWRTVFVCTGALAALMLLAFARALPESLHSLLGLAVAHAGMVSVGFVLLLWQGRVARRMVAVPG
ncbi:hypothetical protein AZKH_1987 [Azoarcus sp. KH32C]|nr:hypothetical protein AZKH_1987 [Azoarcus sp. KH32C]